LAIAWVLAKGRNIIPIPGTKRRKYLLDNAGAVDVNIGPDDLTAIDRLVRQYPNVGDRYNESNKKFVDKS